MPEKLSRFLLITNDDYLSRLFSALLKDTGFHLITSGGGESTMQDVRRSEPALVLLDVDQDPGIRLIDLCRILVENPRPVLMVTRDSEASRKIVTMGLNFGAVDVLVAPEAMADLMPSQRQRLLRALSTGSTLHVTPLALKDIAAAMESISKKEVGSENLAGFLRSHLVEFCNFDVVGVAVSTGGPNALNRFVPLIPAAFPVPILVVQHIIPGIIDGLVKRLGDSCEVRVKTAERGEKLESGTVYFAPDNIHLTVGKDADGALRVQLSDEPSHPLFRPSADVLFGSMAESCGRRCLGVIMTGMGRDGVEGLQLIKQAGGVTVAQDRQSSSIYGMARVAVDSKLIDHVVPLNRIASEIYRLSFEWKTDYLAKSRNSS